MEARDPGRRCGIPIRLSVAFVTLLFALGVGGDGVFGASPIEVVEDSDRIDEDDYVSLKDAIDRVEKDYVSLIVVYDGGGDYESKPKDIPGRWASYLGQRTFRKAVKKHALARLTDKDLDRTYPGRRPEEKPPKEGAEKPAKKPRGKAGADGRPANVVEDWTNAKVLGITRGFPAVVLLDFRERIVKRYTRKLPSRVALGGLLKALAEKNRRLAIRARQVEKVIEGSLYAHKLGDKRSAVLKILSIIKPETLRKFDPVTKKKVQDVQARYRREAQILSRKASGLEAARKYAMAMMLLEQIARDYPFPDVIRDSNQSRGRVFRKAQMGA